MEGDWNNFPSETIIYESHFRMIVACFFTFLLSLASSQETPLIAKLRSNQPFQHNLLSDLHSPSLSKATSDIIGSVNDETGNLYVVGHIHLIDSNTPPDAVDNVPGDDLRSDNDDILLTCVTRNGSVSWSRRTGSALRDVATAIAIDLARNIYIAAYVEGIIGDYGSGAVVMKFDEQGRRLWVESYGSKRGRERLNALVVNADGSNLVAVGEASSSSALLSDVWEGGPGLSALAIIINTKTGSLTSVSHASTLPGSSALSASTAIIVVVNETETVFAAGSATVSENGRTNGAVFSFSLPDLKQVGGIIVESPRLESFTSISSSLNKYSVYVTGSTFLSDYEEHDALVTRLNTTDLGIGWSIRLGSIRFESIASIRNGAAEEYGREIRVDEFGSIHVLIESTSRMRAFEDVGSEPSNDIQSNKRIAIVSLTPHGTVFHVIQSRCSTDMTVMAFELMDDVILASGSIFNSTTMTTQSMLSGMERDNATFGKHGNEFRPDAVYEDEETSDALLETFKKRSPWIIIISLVGGVSILVVLGIVLITCIGRRIRERRLRISHDVERLYS